MKAIVYRRFGSPDVLELAEIEKQMPGDGEVLLKVRAASVNPLDWRLMSGGPYVMRLMLGAMLRKPYRIGRDVAGVVEAIGRNVTRFKVGDEVFGVCSAAFAEYATAKESGLVLKPRGVTFEQAASIPVAGLTALQGIRDHGKLEPGQRFAVNGAAGGVGTFAVQIAKWRGAHVTGVCSTRNIEMVRSIGADEVVDYTREDFTRRGETWDVLLDCVGNVSPSDLRRALSPHGRCFLIGGPKKMAAAFGRAISAVALSRLGTRKFGMFIAKSNQADLTTIAELVESGTVQPVIEKVYALSEVPEAIRHSETGHARGKLVVAVA